MDFGIHFEDTFKVKNDFIDKETKKSIILYDWQIRALKEFLEHKNLLVECATGTGKCLGKGTKVRMFDCSIKNIEDIKVGDKVMGDDSTKRSVISLTNGKEQMYEVIQNKGDNYIINESHILSLKYTNIDKIRQLKNRKKLYKNKKSKTKIDIPLKDYLKLTKSGKHPLKGYKVPIDFNVKDVKIDPYFLGLWLGDGNSYRSEVCSYDKEIKEYIYWYAKKLNMKVHKQKSSETFHISNGYNQKIKNSLLENMKKYNLIKNKHIPKEYLYNSRKIRLEVLGGLLDTDGCYTCGIFDIVQKSKQLSTDIVFLARSLGFAVSIKKILKRCTNSKNNFIGYYYHMIIYGNINIIPTKLKRKQALPRKQVKDHLVTGIKIKKLKIDKYYGITLSGNNQRFLLEDFTVVHNSFYAIECIKKILETEPDINILIICPKNVIMERTWFPELYNAGYTIKDVGIFYGDIKEEMKITITNVQNLKNINFDKYQFVIWDEVHWAAGKQTFKYLQIICKYKLGLTATLKRLDKKHYDILECFNYNLFKYSIKNALDDNVISFFEFYSIGLTMDMEIKEEYDEITDRLNCIYQQHGSYLTIINKGNVELSAKLYGLMNQRKQLVNNYCKKFDVIKEIVKKNINNKILVFNQFNEQTNKTYWELLEAGYTAEIMHSNVKKEKREDILTRYKKDKFNILLTSKVLDEGYNLPSINVAILMSNDTGGKRQLIQRIGRALRKRKDGGYSKIYLIYVKDSIEENMENIMMLRELSSKYNSYFFSPGDEVLIND